MTAEKTPTVEVVYESLPDGTNIEEGASPRAIVEATGLSKSTVNARLRELVKAGRIVQFDIEGERVYRQAFEGEADATLVFNDMQAASIEDDGDPDEPTEDVTPDVPEQHGPPNVEIFGYVEDVAPELEASNEDVVPGPIVTDSSTTVVEVPTVEILSDDGPEGVDVAPDESDAEPAEWPTVTEPPSEPASSSLDDVAAYMTAVRPVSPAPPAEEKPARQRRERQAGDPNWTVFAPGKLQDAILAMLQANPDKEWRASEVGKALNAQAGSVTFALQTLLKKGNVIRTENPPRWRAS